MKKIILVTSMFPYGGGETFLETELQYFSMRKDIELTIIPTLKTEGGQRKIPSDIVLGANMMSMKYNGVWIRLLYLFKSLRNPLFYKEISSEKLNSFTKIKYFFLSMSRYQMFYELWDNLLRQKAEIKHTLMYTYWHNESTYALQSLQKKYGYKLISRIHGGDLYREAREYSYMPLKNHFIDNIDKLFTITPSANKYLEQTYGFEKDKLSVSRLGVIDYGIKAKISDAMHFHVVTCSFLTEVKRIDKIIEALAVLAKKEKQIIIKWTHIGDGALYGSLKTLARNKLEDISNIEYNFIGALENKDIYTFYEKTQIDVFLNASSSEGVPVSIMEAMSCHIPVVAPRVGGIRDMLISNYNGFLLSEKASVLEIANALAKVNIFKDTQIRNHAYEMYLKKYNAKINYENFINTIVKL